MAGFSGYPWVMLYLASQSPRRLELLRQLGLEPGRLDLDVPEVHLPGEPPLDYVSRVAREKAGAGLLQVMSSPGAVVLGADTEVVLDGVVYGKPVDHADAARMLRELSGRTHRVITCVWLVSAGREDHAVCESDVTFDVLDEQRIATYVASGEAMGKAGAYGIQGRAARYVTRIEGSYSNVVGLPVALVHALLAEYPGGWTEEAMHGVPVG